MISAYTNAQLAVTKMFGKNADKVNLGYGGFVGLTIPIGNSENKSIKLEIVDFSIFPLKKQLVSDTIEIGYVSIKAGYKYVFSETKTGFYVEPQIGWCKVFTESTKTYGDNLPSSKEGIALAFEAGYSLEVGQRGNSFDFGLKYETDIAGKYFTISSLGLKVAYNFHLFKSR
ncbi:MAG: hypothetical protein C0459_12655 [Chitinophaga sp.]|nr:hypothetical protein [Chitinophaga sp.]